MQSNLMYIVLIDVLDNYQGLPKIKNAQGTDHEGDSFDKGTIIKSGVSLQSR